MYTGPVPFGRRLSLVLPAALLAAFSVSTASAATITHDFSGTAGTQPAGWNATVVSNTNGSPSPIALDGSGGLTLGGSVSEGGTLIQSSAFQVTDRLAGSDFSISATFTTDAYSESGSGNVQSGLVFLASTEAESDANHTHYRVETYRDNSNAWKVSLRKYDGSSTSNLDVQETNHGALLQTFDTGTTYTISITGTYTQSGDLDFTYSLSDGSVTRGGTATDTDPLAGDYFGVRGRWRSYWNSTAFTDTYDDYSLTYEAVPEPASLGLLGLGSLVLLTSYRRRAE